jgi:hypothetical protein
MSLYYAKLNSPSRGYGDSGGQRGDGTPVQAIVVLVAALSVASLPRVASAAEAPARVYQKTANSRPVIPINSLQVREMAHSLSIRFCITLYENFWTAQQLREAFPWEKAMRYLLRDRDRIFEPDFVKFMKQVKAMGIKQVLAAPCSP